MKILGLPIPFTGERAKALNAVYGGERGGWVPIIREPFTGAWQRNVQIDNQAVQSFHADYACKTLIASDIAKLRVKYVEQDKDKIWFETDNSAYSPVLRRPNNYQNRIQFWENYILSKLSCGNTYVLKERDARGVVNALYVLDPHRCRPLVSDSGDVFYQLDSDNLTGVEENTITIPAREIIHDRMNCIFHPLCGVPPIFASGRASQQGLNIQNNSIRLFKNASTPGGMLLAPGKLNETQITKAKEDWEMQFGGANYGRIAVLGDGLKFEKMALTAVEGQMIEQLKYTAEVVCSTYHVPPYKIGVGPLPSFQNIQSLNVEYYSQALQVLIESAELCLDEGLEIRNGAGTEFDLDGLLRMDSVTQMDVLQKSSGILSPNEQRRKLDLVPKKGGDSPMLQQQDFSLEALAKRDAQDDPFGTAKPAPAPAPADNGAANDDEDDEDIAAAFVEGVRRKSAERLVYV
jgi:HK97 family phage portal protein